MSVICRDEFCKRNGQVKAQCKVAVALIESVYLLFGLAAALCKQHLRRFDHRRVKRSKAVNGVALSERLHHFFHLYLVCRKQLHEARQGSRRNFCHTKFYSFQSLNAAIA